MAKFSKIPKKKVKPPYFVFFFGSLLALATIWLKLHPGNSLATIAVLSMLLAFCLSVWVRI